MSLIFSFILDGIILKYAPYSLFTVLIFIFLPRDNLKKYYIISFLIGLLYDFLYANILFYNSFIFLTIAYFINFYFKKFRYNFINILYLSIMLIIYYYTFSFLILSLIKYISFDLKRYLNIVLNSLILNIFFIATVFLVKRRKLKVKYEN